MKTTHVFPLQNKWFTIVALIMVLLILTISGKSMLPTQAAVDADQVFIAVQFANHDRLVRAVSFSGQITGLDALLQSGLEVETISTSFGTAVCSIEGVGCPASNCFCDPNNFWNYEYWDGSQWQGHVQGAGDTLLSDGDIDGWRWGEWNGEKMPAWWTLRNAWESLGWLRTQQQSDGGFGNMGSSVESAIALGANHERAEDWVASGSSTSLKDYLLANAVSFSEQSAASAGKLAVALRSSGVDDDEFPGGMKTPLDYYNPSTGVMGEGAGPQAWAILGTHALTQTIPVAATNYLKGLAVSGGGWEWYPGWGADTNTTSLAIRALLAAGEDPQISEIQNALQFLRTAQNTDGGFPYDPVSIWGTDSDTNSTAYVLLALYQLNEDVFSTSWRKSVPDSLDFLDCRRLTNGSFEWMTGTGSNMLATQQAITAIFGRPTSPVANDFPICSVNFAPLIMR